mmetsp:Transcript_41776/g.100278  ORF Transcript_41776/g.100278 Transcript_41776/m.100278 type:complete len:97 (+) Transcript_41776:95-385(+)
MSNPWDMVCEWVRSQSANMADVMENLQAQDTISDIGQADELQLQSGVSPLHLFMFALLAIWGYLYLTGRNRGTAGKPASSSDGGPPAPGADDAAVH